MDKNALTNGAIQIAMLVMTLLLVACTGAPGRVMDILNATDPESLFVSATLIGWMCGLHRSFRQEKEAEG